MSLYLTSLLSFIYQQQKTINQTIYIPCDTTIKPPPTQILSSSYLYYMSPSLLSSSCFYVTLLISIRFTLHTQMTILKLLSPSLFPKLMFFPSVICNSLKQEQDKQANEMRSDKLLIFKRHTEEFSSYHKTFLLLLARYCYCWFIIFLVTSIPT